MKASELITLLQDAIDEYGDCEVHQSKIVLDKFFIKSRSWKEEEIEVTPYAKVKTLHKQN